jgi:hypothetical protein
MSRIPRSRNLLFHPTIILFSSSADFSPGANSTQFYKTFSNKRLSFPFSVNPKEPACNIFQWLAKLSDVLFK